MYLRLTCGKQRTSNEKYDKMHCDENWLIYESLTDPVQLNGALLKVFSGRGLLRGKINLTHFCEMDSLPIVTATALAPILVLPCSSVSVSVIVFICVSFSGFSSHLSYHIHLYIVWFCVFRFLLCPVFVLSLCCCEYLVCFPALINKPFFQIDVQYDLV